MGKHKITAGEIKKILVPLCPCCLEPNITAEDELCRSCAEHEMKLEKAAIVMEEAARQLRLLDLEHEELAEVINDFIAELHE